MFDVYIMGIFGLLAYFMRKAGFGTAPTILGVILASMLEANFRRTLILAKGNMLAYFFIRPISIVLALLVIGSLLLPIIVNKVKRKMNSDLKIEEDPENYVSGDID